jgi:hypothetical protein
MKTQHPSQRLFVCLYILLNECCFLPLNAVERAKCAFAISSQEFGGGGHASASSFMISSAEWEQWKVHKNALI